MKVNEARKFKKEQLGMDLELVRIARERLDFDKAEAARQKKFWKMSAGTRVTILVSSAAVISLFEPLQKFLDDIPSAHRQ